MNDHRKISSLGGYAAAASMTPAQRIERATVASEAAKAARAAKALGVVRPDTASRRWRQRRKLKAIAGHANPAGNYGGSPTTDRAKANGGQWHDHRKSSPSRRKA